MERHPPRRTGCFASGLALVLALAFGIAGTFQASRMDVSAALKESSRSSTGSRAQHRVLSGLVITQVVLALVLLAGAASAIRSVFALSQLYKGFDPNDLLTLEVGLPKQSYSDATMQRRLHRFTREPCSRRSQCHKWIQRPLPPTYRPAMSIAKV